MYSTSATTHMQAKTEVDAPAAAYSSRPLTTSLPVSTVSENSTSTSRDTVVMTLMETRIFHVLTTSTSCTSGLDMRVRIPAAAPAAPASAVLLHALNFGVQARVHELFRWKPTSLPLAGRRSVRFSWRAAAAALKTSRGEQQLS